MEAWSADIGISRFDEIIKFVLRRLLLTDARSPPRVTCWLRSVGFQKQQRAVAAGAILDCVGEAVDGGRVPRGRASSVGWRGSGP
jgi:hypothetical protein